MNNSSGPVLCFCLKKGIPERRGREDGVEILLCVVDSKWMEEVESHNNLQKPRPCILFARLKSTVSRRYRTNPFGCVFLWVNFVFNQMFWTLIFFQRTVQGMESKIPRLKLSKRTSRKACEVETCLKKQSVISREGKDEG